MAGQRRVHHCSTTFTSFVRLDVPALMDTADFRHWNFSATRFTSFSFAFPSTGGDFNFAIQVPSVAWESSDTLDRGFTLI